MPSPDVPQDSPSLTSPTASHLLTQFTTFLTLLIHSLLYHRALYPSTSFTAVRAYDLPVHQSRHPGVCQWINDAISATAEQLRQGAVEKIVFSVLHGKGQTSWKVMERWVVDVSGLPTWGKEEVDAEGGEEEGEEHAGEDEQQQPEVAESEVTWSEVHEALRGALRRVAYAAEKMEKLPEGCTFTLAVELRDQAQAPAQHPQHWIPSYPTTKNAGETQSRQLGPAALVESTSPVRSVHAGPLFFECWVEHARTQSLASGSSVDQAAPTVGARNSATTSS